jgi:sarcosine oxidase subunit gamma
MTKFNVCAVPELRTSLIYDTGEIDTGEIDTGEIQHQGEIRLFDCTMYSRIGFRGPDAAKFLHEMAFPVPDWPNQAEQTENGLLVLRLSQTEFWVLDTVPNASTQDDVIARLEQVSAGRTALHTLYCQHSHACIKIEGHDLPAFFAKVCGVDLRSAAFPDGQIAQTSLARVNAIIVRTTSSQQAQYWVLSDISGSQYLWDALLDAATHAVG